MREEVKGFARSVAISPPLLEKGDTSSQCAELTRRVQRSTALLQRPFAVAHGSFGGAVYLPASLPRIVARNLIVCSRAKLPYVLHLRHTKLPRASSPVADNLVADRLPHAFAPRAVAVMWGTSILSTGRVRGIGSNSSYLSQCSSRCSADFVLGVALLDEPIVVSGDNDQHSSIRAFP